MDLGNIQHRAGTHPGSDAYLSLGTTHTFTLVFTPQGRFRVPSVPARMWEVGGNWKFVIELHIFSNGTTHFERLI